MKKKKPIDEITEKMAEEIRDAIDDNIIQNLKHLANVQPMDGSVHPQVKFNSNDFTPIPGSTLLAQASNKIYKKTKKQANYIALSPKQNMVLTSAPVIAHKKSKLKGKWTVQTQSQLKALFGMDMIHPYGSEIAGIKISRIEKDLKKWSDEKKNVFFHYVLVNPFNIPSFQQETYFYIFQKAILIHQFADANRFGITKADIIKEIGQFDKNKIDIKVSHAWIVLKSLVDQNAL